MVQVRVDTTRIRSGFALEKPPVPEAEWDADAYVEYRTAAYRNALDATVLAAMAGGVIVDVQIGMTFDAAHDPVSIDCPASAGDRVRIVAVGELAEASLPALGTLVAQALHPMLVDAGAWRRYLRPAYFERHRAWRSSVGSPIQH